MKNIYLDKNSSSQKIISGNPITGDAIYGDLTAQDIGIRKVGVEYDVDGVAYRSYRSGLNENPSTGEINVDVITEIKNSKGEWKSVETWNFKPNPDHYRYNNPTKTNFSVFEPNPYDENGSLKSDLVDEVEFFYQNIMLNKFGLPISMASFFIDGIKSRV